MIWPMNKTVEIAGVWYSSNTAIPKQYSWYGSSWVFGSTFPFTLSSNAAYLLAVPQTGSNQIMLMAQDTSERISTALWNGSTYTAAAAALNKISNADTNLVQVRSFDGAWVVNSSSFVLASLQNAIKIPLNTFSTDRSGMDSGC